MHTLKALKLAACRKRRRAREVVDANGAVGRWKPRVGAGSIGASSMALARTHASPSAPGLSASSLASSLLCPSFPSPAGQGCMLIRRVQLSKCATQAGRRSRGGGYSRHNPPHLLRHCIMHHRRPSDDDWPLLFLSRPFRPRCLCLFFCRLASPFSQSPRAS